MAISFEKGVGILRLGQIVRACTQGVHSITWRAKYGGMDVPDARRLRELEAENNKLKKLLTEVQWDIHALNTDFGARH